jgi:ATP-binding cassette subfamily B protein
VVVLDEATRNLDLGSESKIEKALQLLLKKRTALIIAHRLTTAMRADRIAVFHRGRLIEVGTHQELLERDGTYAKMHATWAKSVA